MIFHYPSNTRRILTMEPPLMTLNFLGFFVGVFLVSLFVCRQSSSPSKACLIYCFFSSTISAQHVSSLLGIFGGHCVTGTIPGGHPVAVKYQLSVIHTQCLYFTSFSEMKRIMEWIILFSLNPLIRFRHCNVTTRECWI